MNSSDLQQYWYLVVVLVAWTMAWKGWALWRAARVGSKAWFVILFILNTLGLLEILYIFVFSKQDAERAEVMSTLPPKE